MGVFILYLLVDVLKMNAFWNLGYFVSFFLHRK